MKRLLSFAVLFWAILAGQAQAQFTRFDYSVVTTPTVQNASYAQGNAMGGLQTITVFRTETAPGGYLTEFWIASKTGNTGAMTIYIFDTAPSASTTCTDKSAFVLAAADVAKLAVLPFVLTPAVPQSGTAAIAEKVLAASVWNNDATQTKKLYLCIIANGSITPGSVSDIVFKLGLRQD